MSARSGDLVRHPSFRPTSVAAAPARSAGESAVPTRFRWMRLRPQELALVAITAIWGSTFLLVHWAMEHSDPWFFVGLRFLVAALVAVLIFWRSLRGMTW